MLVTEAELQFISKFTTVTDSVEPGFVYSFKQTLSRWLTAFLSYRSVLHRADTCCFVLSIHCKSLQFYCKVSSTSKLDS